MSSGIPAIDISAIVNKVLGAMKTTSRRAPCPGDARDASLGPRARRRVQQANGDHWRLDPTLAGEDHQP